MLNGCFDGLAMQNAAIVEWPVRAENANTRMMFVFNRELFF